MYGDFDGGMLRNAVAESAQDSASKGGAPAPTAAGSGGYSGTNNQVEAVDEGDIIKTDGEQLWVGVPFLLGQK